MYTFWYGQKLDYNLHVKIKKYMGHLEYDEKCKINDLDLKLRMSNR